jgi:hypothetical protein
VSGVVLAAAVVASGCAGRHAVVAMSSTTIGVVVHQNEKQQTPEMKVGYNREEFAYVPTNRSGEDNATTNNSLGGGAKDTGNVIMEIRGGGNVGLSAVGQGEIYQRLAVGDIAVAQPGAAFMVAKDANGNLDSNTAAQVANAFVATARFQTPDQKSLQSLLDEVADHPQRDALLDKAVAALPDQFKKSYDRVKAKGRSSQRAFESAMDDYLEGEPGNGPKHTELIKALRSALQ